jgi:anti-sigma factor ChrR (cupin superfamily)
MADMFYANLEDIEWEDRGPGARRKVVRVDDEVYVGYTRWDPGYELAYLDTHGGREIVFIIEGTFVDHNGSHGPGTVIISEPGSAHQPSAPDGVTFFTVRTYGPGERQAVQARRPT